MRTTMKKMSLVLYLLLALYALGGLGMQPAWAHGGVDDEKPEPANAPAAAVSGATETDLELHLEDLNQAAAGTSAPLQGAKIRGFLKHGDGDMLSRITVVEEKTPGYYLVRFGDAASYRFSEAGKYLLELNIQPVKGDSVSTTVAFELPKPAPPGRPLWQRLTVLILGLILVVALLVFFRNRRGGGRGSSLRGTGSRENVAAVLLLSSVIGSAVAGHRAWAHGGVDDEKPDPAAQAGAAPVMADSPAIQPGQISATTKVGGIRITLIARTRPAKPEVLAPGEVELPAQTAELLQIKTEPVKVGRLATGVSFSGQIAASPNGAARIASIVPGRVTRLDVGQGDIVQRGQIVAVVESRAVGEAQSAYQQALARFRNAQSNASVIQKQARAGVFSRAPLDVARRAQAEAAGDVRAQQAAVEQAQVAFDNAARLSRVGGFASPALETARNNEAQAREAVGSAQAALTNAQASVESGQAELARRRQLASAGTYVARPTEEARRSLVAAQSARAAAQSEVATTRANLSRNKSLAAEGLVSQRDLEAAQQAFDTASTRLETGLADERTASQELARQQQLASTNVNGAAEVQAAQAQLATAQADVRTRQAEAQRARTQLQVARVALSREQAIFDQNIANRREIGTARANLQAAQAGLYKAQRTLEVANAMLQRERSIFRQNLNNISQVQAATAGFLQAQADLKAARSTLSLLKSSPGGSVAVPVRSPLTGVIQTRDVALGELVQTDAPLMTVVDLSRVSLEAALFEADYARIRIGSPVRVTTDAVPGRSFAGRISYLGSSVDPQTHTLIARAVINNPGGLRPGMFARGQIETGISAPTISVPATAVLEDGAAKVAFVTKGDKYERREVKVGTESNGRVEIREGLRPGDEVVTEGAAALRAQAAKGT